jgi:hypothetical protein
MATAPAYAATPLLGAALISNGTADSFPFTTAPAHATTLFTAGSNGTKLVQVDLIPAGTISSGGVVVVLFLYNGTSYFLHEAVLVPAVTPASQVAPAKISYYYDSCVLPSNSWSLVATETVATQPVQVNAYGASL